MSEPCEIDSGRQVPSPASTGLQFFLSLRIRFLGKLQFLGQPLKSLRARGRGMHVSFGDLHSCWDGHSILSHVLLFVFLPPVFLPQSSRNTRVFFFFYLAWRSNVEQLLQNQLSFHLSDISVVSTQCPGLQKSFIISFGQSFVCL